MRFLLLASLLAVGCGSTEDRRSPLSPSEFHLFVSHTESDSVGGIHRGGRNGYQTATDGDSNSLTVGWTWSLQPPLRARVPRWRFPAMPPEPEAMPPTSTGHYDFHETDGHEPEHHEHHEHPEPVPVVVTGMLDEAWTRFLGAATLLAGALALWVGRQRIPYVRRYTAEGRARRAEERPEDDPEA